MHATSPPLWRIFLAATWLLVVGGGLAVRAQNAPTTDQLEIFRNLTPEQQQAVLEQMAGQQGGTTTTSSGGSSKQSQTGTATSAAGDNQRRRSPAATDEEPKIPKLKPQDTVLVQASWPTKRAATPEVNTPDSPSLDPKEKARLDDEIQQIRSRNPFRLDRNGQLNLPGFAPIALGGLTEAQATQRLAAEPTLIGLDVKLVLLPLERSGVDGLKPFGYDLFDDTSSTFSTFSPVTDVPVPADYVIGAGDELNVQLFGKENRNSRLTVNRDGSVNFPELGPLRVGGMTFNDARRLIESRVAQQLIGVQASVSMGNTRSIRVFVLGEAKQPGSFTVSGLATMTSALFASGGVKPIGSLRDIQLKRQGAIVRHLDLYDFLISGDTSDDAKLLPGDVIFIPPVGSTVSVDGEVKRPAIYEIKGEGSIHDVVRMAGGFTPEADTNRASLTRIDANSRRIVLNVSLMQSGGRIEPPRNGDVLRVARLRPQLDDGVTVDGFVYRPGNFAWHQGLRLTDVIGSIDELKPGADQHYVLIRRESGADRHVSVVSADLTAALVGPTSSANVALLPRDRVTVFDLAPGRERIINPLLEEIRLQSELARPTEVVRVGGKVKVPGEYPLEPGMRISDLLRAGGNLDSSAFGGSAELTRYATDATGSRQTELVSIDLAAARRGDPAANLPLQPFDYLIVKETPDWTDLESVTLRGEVRFPGTYPIRKGETLREVLNRAGGLTAQAFPEGGAFTRRDLRELEQQQLDRLAERMRSDLASLTLQAANAGKSDATQSLLAGQSVLQQLQGSKAVGRFVIDLPDLIAGQVGGPKDFVLRDGDELLVPRQRQEVTVIGEVQNATSHLYLRSLKRGDYIALSGGTGRKADNKHIYIVRADGSTATKAGSWLTRNYDAAIKPGDTIVVPLDTERMPRLPFWQAVTQILYNLAVSVAALNSF